MVLYFPKDSSYLLQNGMCAQPVIPPGMKRLHIMLLIHILQEWTDERLIWSNMTEFSPIKMIRIPCDLLWLPDIVLYNR